MVTTRAARRLIPRFSWLLVVALVLPACSAATAPASSAPQPEIYPIEPVRLSVQYSGREDNGRGDGSRCRLRVDPEVVNIFYQYDREHYDRLKDVEVLWKIEGLRHDHTVFIVAKDNSPKGLFNTPKTYRERDAFYIDGKNNAIRSGTANGFPKDLLQKEGPKKVTWYYDVVVVDAKGEELCSVDPEVVVAGHP
ncbi:MAG: hypothetical protein KDD11_13770 [Acidobacteria bacterium]|nr:hypothetical protein [Acidobacteriota bacterium]